MTHNIFTLNTPWLVGAPCHASEVYNVQTSEMLLF